MSGREVQVVGGEIYVVSFAGVNATTSAEIEIGNGVPVAIECPASTASTAFTFTCSRVSGGTFITLYNAGANVSITVAASKRVALDPAIFAALNGFIKVTGNGDDRNLTFNIICRRLA